MEKYIELNLWPDGAPESNELNGIEDLSAPGLSQMFQIQH